ncbi:translation initiation factor 2 [Streptomyces sp. NPDC045431]|uniref:translation initiation factor 2 n=1 Tax=Streptomyces sp. NPDC045431 TaxID=3155613 RepID=UPI0033E48411
MLFAVRSATALHRLLDVMPVFHGDHRIHRRFVLVPGSDFGVGALAALEQAGARTVAWDEAVASRYDLVVAASPKGRLELLDGPLVLMPHGAGFNKAVEEGGSADSASGLDPSYLMRDGRPLAAVHALAHGRQIERIAAACPRAARRGVVVGDPTLDRILTSTGLRDRYRAALGTGARRLVVVASTWGPESLIRRRPGLAAELVGALPYDGWQVAVVVHPNEFSEVGAYDLRLTLGPALDAGAVLARPYEEWGALLVASDVVVTDHGSAALYAAALDRPVVGAYDGGRELIEGSPMARLLGAVPAFGGARELDRVVREHRAGGVRAYTRGAFACEGESLERLRAEVYRLLGLDPPGYPAEPRPLPVPTGWGPAPGGPGAVPAAFAVRAAVDGRTVDVERYPAAAEADVDVDHLAAEDDLAGVRQRQSAALLYRRAEPADGAAAWAARTLAAFPGCRTAAVVRSPERFVVRRRDGEVYDVAAERRHRADPAALLSGVHAWLERGARPGGGGGGLGGSGEVWCVVGGRRVSLRLSPRP